MWLRTVDLTLFFRCFTHICVCGCVRDYTEVRIGYAELKLNGCLVEVHAKLGSIAYQVLLCFVRLFPLLLFCYSSLIMFVHFAYYNIEHLICSKGLSAFFFLCFYVLPLFNL
jgi:hypothetical protein